jgi:hypothetical protein
MYGRTSVSPVRPEPAQGGHGPAIVASEQRGGHEQARPVREHPLRRGARGGGLEVPDPGRPVTGDEQALPVQRTVRDAGLLHHGHGAPQVGEQRIGHLVRRQLLDRSSLGLQDEHPVRAPRYAPRRSRAAPAPPTARRAA